MKKSLIALAVVGTFAAPAIHLEFEFSTEIKPLLFDVPKVFYPQI